MPFLFPFSVCFLYFSLFRLNVGVFVDEFPTFLGEIRVNLSFILVVFQVFLNVTLLDRTVFEVVHGDPAKN